MKTRILLSAALALLMAFPAHLKAQTEPSDWTLNTRVWSTNYFTTTIYGVAESLVKHFALKGHPKDSLWAERLLPDPNLVFPIGMGKRGFDAVGGVYGPYHYAFGNPFKHPGDYAIGVDASYHPCILGVYGGAYFKSQEIVFKASKDNLRGYYFQPRVGLILGDKDKSIEAGVFYDVLTGCGGEVGDTHKDRLKGGWGLDFALTVGDKKDQQQTVLQFSMSLHNFLDPSYPGQAGMKRKVGYLMLTQRFRL
ncbi:MAG: hypothetical protein IJS89_04625 [Bacteroidaceae bacterium]|nr:hypothetical protein [Bacteroidaceae bacterium]